MLEFDSSKRNFEESQAGIESACLAAALGTLSRPHPIIEIAAVVLCRATGITNYCMGRNNVIVWGHKFDTIFFCCLSFLCGRANFFFFASKSSFCMLLVNLRLGLEAGEGRKGSLRSSKSHSSVLYMYQRIYRGELRRVSVS